MLVKFVPGVGLTMPSCALGQAYPTFFQRFFGAPPRRPPPPRPAPVQQRGYKLVRRVRKSRELRDRTGERCGSVYNVEPGGGGRMAPATMVCQQSGTVLVQFPDGSIERRGLWDCICEDWSI